MNTVNIFIKNFLDEGGSVITTSTLFQTVPINTEYAITNPRVKGEIGKASTFEFSIDPEHPFYDRLIQIKTLFRVEYVGITIFRGRVLTIDIDMNGVKSIHCEGDFAFLLDTPQPGSKEDDRPTISVDVYLEQLVAQHNAMSEEDKHFILGEYPGHYTAAVAHEQQIIPSAEQINQKFGNNSWNNTMNRFEDLLGIFGGYWRTRYVNDTHVYLDWFDRYFRSNADGRRRIEVTRNLINFSGSAEVDNIFTSVIPIGKQNSKDLYLSHYWPNLVEGHAQVNYIDVPELVTCNLIDPAELNLGHHTVDDYLHAIDNYGRIFKIVTFENADMEDKLVSYAVDWIKNNYVGQLVNYDVTALDMATFDPSAEPILAGDEVTLVHPAAGEETLTVISVDYDLYQPWNNKYKIGIPNNMLNASYGVANKKGSGGKSSDSTISGGGGGGGGGDDEEDIAEQQRKEANAFNLAYTLKANFKENIPLDDQLAFLAYDEHGQKFTDPKDAVKQIKKLPLNARRQLGTLLSLPGFAKNPDLFMRAVQDTGLYDDLLEARDSWRQGVSNYAQSIGVSLNKAEVITHDRAASSWLANLVDDDGNPKGPLKDKELVKMAKNARDAFRGVNPDPTAQMLGTSTFAQLAGDLLGDSLSIGIDDLIVDPENLKFTVFGGKASIDGNANTVEFDDMRILRKVTKPDGSSVSFGLYDEDNLTAGVMVEKMSNGVTKTKISSDWLDLDSDQTIIKVKNFIGNVTGVTEANWDSYNGVSLSTISGSTLWANRNDITGVVGEFDVVGEGANRRVVVKSGGGLRIRKNNTEFGLYDEDNLTAGVMVDKINNGETTVKIQASKVDLGAYATVTRLDAVEAKIDDLMAGRITASVISATKVIAGKLVTTDTPSGQDVPVSVDADWHNFTVDGKKLASFLGTADINFNIADTDTYKAAIGVKSIYLTDDSTPPSYSNGYLSVPVSAMPNAGGEARATLSVDASNAYSAGYNGGYSRGKSDGGALSDSWNGATYTVTSGSGKWKQISLSHNNPSWDSSAGNAGSLTYYIYAGGDTRLSIWVSGLTPYNQGYSDGYAAAGTSAYNSGWNDCIDAATSKTCLTGYSTWNNGSKANLYVAPTGGANIATGKSQVWRYGGSVKTYYSLPSKK